MIEINIYLAIVFDEDLVAQRSRASTAWLQHDFSLAALPVEAEAVGTEREADYPQGLVHGGEKLVRMFDRSWKKAVIHKVTVVRDAWAKVLSGFP